MSPTEIILLAISGALLGALVVNLMILQKLRKERASIAETVRATGGTSLEEAVRSLASRADEAAALPLFKTRLERMLLDSPLPVLLLNEQRLIVDLSARAEQELDQPRRRRGLLETMGSHELDEAARSAMASLKPAIVTVRLYAGGRHTYQARLIPYHSGEAAECLVFLQDVAATMDFGELRSQFAATVSHELRTPLAGIRAMVEALQDPAISPEEASRFLGRVDQETQRLGQLVDEILFLSSLESGATEAISGKTDTAEVVEKIVAKLESLARQSDISIDNQVRSGLVLPLSDRMATTVLTNLLENAIKYSGRGSHVELNAERVGGGIKIVVRDDGIGIDAEHLPHIFERFYRVDKSRSRRMGGTGLGLSIVKHVVESGGGKVSAKSREGFGTQVTLSFPARS
jgi:two-component system phosphate regulon sensor histidine kinase PhoR